MEGRERRGGGVGGVSSRSRRETRSSSSSAFAIVADCLDDVDCAARRHPPSTTSTDYRDRPLPTTIPSHTSRIYLTAPRSLDYSGLTSFHTLTPTFNIIFTHCLQPQHRPRRPPSRSTRTYTRPLFAVHSHYVRRAPSFASFRSLLDSIHCCILLFMCSLLSIHSLTCSVVCVTFYLTILPTLLLARLPHLP